MTNPLEKLVKQAQQQQQKEESYRHHEFDDDACCIHCGFDGAEWHHWKHYTYEGQAQPAIKMPRCEEKF